MTPDEMIEVIQAYKDGKKIECCPIGKDKWYCVPDPSWSFGIYLYRAVTPVPYDSKDYYDMMVSNKGIIDSYGNTWSIASVGIDKLYIKIDTYTYSYTYEEITRHWTNIDGSPLTKEV